MLVTIAVMGRDSQDVTLNDGATLLEALQFAQIDPDTINDARRGGQSITLSTTLANGDTVLVYTGGSKKMSGGNEDAATTAPHKGFVLATFDVIHEGETPRSGNGVPVEGTKVLDVALWYAKSKGIGLASLKAVLVDGVEKAYADTAVDGKYTLVLKKNEACHNDCVAEFDDDEDW